LINLILRKPDVYIFAKSVNESALIMKNLRQNGAYDIFKTIPEFYLGSNIFKKIKHEMS
jgi:hypothetical protein